MLRWDHERVSAWEVVVRMGHDGWELVAVDQDKYLLKRPVPSIREVITQQQRNDLAQKKKAGPT
jgi:hypothetical protein